MNYLIVFVLACLAVANAQKDFTCADPKPGIVNFYGNNLTCPGTTICNVKYKLINRETKPRPCIAPSEICEYTCGSNSSLVTINTINFQCASGQICNKEKLSCEVCVCARNQFTCKDKTNVVLPGGYGFACNDKEVCNAEYKSPCSPCIAADSTEVAPSKPNENGTTVKAP